jgi:hypothetical protein
LQGIAASVTLLPTCIAAQASQLMSSVMRYGFQGQDHKNGAAIG